MYDLQALAFAGDITRVFSFKTGRDGSARVYPESGVNLPFHPASHHGEREDRVTQFAAINKYQVGLLPYFLDKLKAHQGRRRQPARPDGDRLRLADGQLERAQPQALPAVPGGAGGGMLKGGLHLQGARTARRWRTCS